MVLLQLFCHCSQSHSPEGAGHVHPSAGVLSNAPPTVEKKKERKRRVQFSQGNPSGSSLVPGKQLRAPGITIY